MLDLDPGRCQDRAVRSAEVERQATGLGRLLERLGGRYIADVAPSGGRRLYVAIASPMPWLEVRDLVRAISLRFPAVDHGPHDGLGGQISPPGCQAQVRRLAAALGVAGGRQGGR